MPNGWEYTTLDSLTTEENARVGRMKSATVLSSTKYRGLVPSDDYFKNRAIYSADLSNYKSVEDGWFAYATNHLTEGSIGLFRGAAAACVSPIYTVFSCKPQVHPEYLFRLVKSPRLMNQYRVYEQASVDRRGAVRYRDFGRVLTLLPPLSEQLRIASILDTLDEAIRRTEDIIAKLKRIRQGLLRDLLTQGVDENGEIRSSPDDAPHLYKDSPIGRMPRSWDCSLLDDVFDVQPGLTLGPHRAPRNSPFPYLRVANVFKGNLDLSDIASLNARPFEVAHQLLRAGDLLLVEGHANIEEIGRVALADERVAGFTYQNHLLRLRPHTLEPDYCELWLNGPWVRSYWRRMCSTSSGLNTINQHTLKAIPVPIPSREERGRITATAEMHSTRVSTESAVLAKYRSLKAGLLDDLLSGRVRLRGSAEPRA